ncbi:MAG TPA: hypothetical protein VL098_07070 [Flavipsychrobacter sp.]|nr:hypothetical protein [Flavipsychrobacter sp.]
MKLLRFTSLASAILVAAFVFTGCTRRDDYYDPPPPTGYQYEFTEEFDNDTRGWAFTTDSSYALVQSGEYVFVDNSVNGELNTAVIPTGCDVDRDFLIQTRLESDNSIALIFGAYKQQHYGYSFFIDNSYQSFAIYNEGSSSQPLQTIKDFTVNGAINKTGYNNVEIEQRNGRWYFYINNTEVHSMQAEYLSGDEMGFMVLGQTKGYADYLRVKW